MFSCLRPYAISQASWFLLYWEDLQWVDFEPQSNFSMQLKTIKSNFLKSLCFGHWRKETVFLGYVCTENSGSFVLEGFHLLWLHVSISAVELGKNFVLVSLWLCVQVCVSLYVCESLRSCRLSLLVVFGTGGEKGATPIILFDSWEQGQHGDGVPQCNCKNKQHGSVWRGVGGAVHHIVEQRTVCIHTHIHAPHSHANS